MAFHNRRINHSSLCYRFDILSQGTNTSHSQHNSASSSQNFLVTGYGSFLRNPKLLNDILLTVLERLMTKNSVSLGVALSLAAMDYRRYLFILLQHTSISSQKFRYFFLFIVSKLGYDSVSTILLTVPVWFLTFLVSLLVIWTAGRSGDRSIHIKSLMAVPILATSSALHPPKSVHVSLPYSSCHWGPWPPTRSL